MDEHDDPKHPLHADLFLHGWMEYQRLFDRNGVRLSKLDIVILVTMFWAREFLEAGILLNKCFCEKSQ